MNRKQIFKWLYYAYDFDAESYIRDLAWHDYDEPPSVPTPTVRELVYLARSLARRDARQADHAWDTGHGYNR